MSSTSHNQGPVSLTVHVPRGNRLLFHSVLREPYWWSMAGQGLRKADSEKKWTLSGLWGSACGINTCEREWKETGGCRGRSWAAKQAGNDLGPTHRVLTTELGKLLGDVPSWAKTEKSWRLRVSQGGLWAGSCLELRPSLQGLSAEGCQQTALPAPGARSLSLMGTRTVHDRGHHAEDPPHIVAAPSEHVSRYLSLGSPTGWPSDWDVSTNSLLGNMEARWGRKGNQDRVLSWTGCCWGTLWDRREQAPELSHSGGKEGVVFIQQILCVTTQGCHSLAVPTCLAHLSKEYQVTAGRMHWCEWEQWGPGDMSGDLTVSATPERREPGQSLRNVILPQPRSDTFHTSTGRASCMAHLWWDGEEVCHGPREGRSGYCWALVVPLPFWASIY